MCLMIRHPEAVRGAVMHEPGLYALVDDFDAVRDPVRVLARAGDGAVGTPRDQHREHVTIALYEGQVGGHPAEPSWRFTTTT